MISIYNIKKVIQNQLINIYGVLNSYNFFSGRFGTLIQYLAYFTYKKLYEKNINYLEISIKKNSTIIDVGANVGFYSKIFSRWVDKGGTVIAIEPECKNYKQLEKLSQNYRNIEPILAAATDKKKNLFLALNKTNPADHRIAQSGQSIAGISIDELMEDRSWPNVSLIKIDVQGHEMQVLKGSKETIIKNHPMIMVEIDDEALTSAGTIPDDVIDYIRQFGYSMYQIGSEYNDVSITNIEAKIMREVQGYSDYIFK